MRNWNQYNELWQQKRNELHVDTDMQTDWSEMQHLLNEQMPLNSHAANNGATSTGTQLAHLAKFKLLYVIAGFMIAGIVTYVAINKISNKPAGHHQKDKTEIRKDSISTYNALKTDSLDDRDNSAANHSDNADGADHKSSGAARSAGQKDDIAAEQGNNNAVEERSATTSSEKSNRLLASSADKNNRLLGDNSNKRSNNRLEKNADSFNPINRRGDHSSNNQGQRNAGNTPGGLVQGRQASSSLTIIDATPAQSALTWEDVVSVGAEAPVKLANPFVASVRKLSAEKMPKAAKITGGSNFDWGLLIGADTKGSFTTQAKNHNFYGSLPVDIYVGAFGTYNFSDRWALGLQGKVLTPHSVSGSYSYTHTVLVDTPQTSETLQINDSRKLYTIDVPVHLIYKASPNVNIKLGPLLSIPVKEANGSGTIFTKTRKDSLSYYAGVTNTLKATRIEKKIHYGVSAGLGFNYKLLRIDATYNYNFQPQKVSSALGGYTSNTNSLQLTIGIKLNKSKK